MAKAPAYLHRTIEPALKRAARDFPAVVLTGPRQSGKTTVLRHLFGHSHGYVSLDTPDVLASALTDPRAFLDRFTGPVILDEIQHAAGLLPFLRECIDSRRHEHGRFILTGSQNLALAQAVSESLAGRAGVLTLLPLSMREWARQPRDHPLWSSPRAGRGLALPRTRLWLQLLRGSFPELAASPSRDAAEWQASYVRTYLERDVRSLRQVGDLTTFQAFLQLVAARSGQLLSLTDLSRDLGVAVNTAKAWLSVLEATYQVIIVRPHYANIGKRLVKTPKVYLADTGLLCYLTQVGTASHAASGPLAGAIVETAVAGELVKSFMHSWREPRITFWRTATGHEVDFLIDTGTQLVPIEVKASSTVRPEMASGIHALRRDLGDRVGPGYVVHTGDTTLPLGDRVTAVPFAAL